MADWLAEQLRHDRNVYFSLNEPRADAKHGKLAKTDIAQLRAVFCDVDPEGGAEQLETERARIKGAMVRPEGRADAALLRRSIRGGGCQAFWRVETIEANAANVKLAEGIGAALSKALGGDPVQNIDRIARLPGRDNIPGAVKLRKGRIRRRATVLFDTKATYTLDQLAEEFRPPVAEKTTQAGAEEWSGELDMAQVRACPDLRDLPGDLPERFDARAQTLAKTARALGAR